MKIFFLSRLRAFKYAFEGWLYVIRTQRNAWIHTAATIFVVALGIWLNLDHLEWALVLIAVTLVWFAEFLNTALEAIVDLASPEHHYLAKIGKDVGAAAVLIAASASVLIGILVFFPHFLEKF